jgi:hypothetical protein
MAYHYTSLNEINTKIKLLHLLPVKREDATPILIEHGETRFSQQYLSGHSVNSSTYRQSY